MKKLVVLVLGGLLCVSASAQMSVTTKNAIITAIHDERESQEQYLAMGRQFGMPMFQHLAQAEARHEAALVALLRKANLEPPEASKVEFVPPATLIEAGQRGVKLERANIAMYNGFLKTVKEPEVRRVFLALRRVSAQHHLRAMQGLARGQMGAGRGIGVGRNGIPGQGMGQGRMGRGPGMGQGQMGQGRMGQGQMGQGRMGQGRMGQGRMGQGRMGQGRMGQGQVGQGRMGQGRMGQGRMGQGRMGQGQVGQGRMGQGRVGQGRGMRPARNNPNAQRRAANQRVNTNRAAGTCPCCGR